MGQHQRRRHDWRRTVACAGDRQDIMDSAVDQARFEQSNHRRVTQLVQSLTYWLARDL